MTITTALSSYDVQNVRNLESTDPSPAAAAVDVRHASVDDREVLDEVEHGWDEFREPYSPWTGVRTAVSIAVLLTAFVVYVTVRARCTPECRHDVLLAVRRVVRSFTPSCLLPKNGRDEDDIRRRSPIVAESPKRCLRRIELELVEVVGDQNSTSCGHSVDAS